MDRPLFYTGGVPRSADVLGIAKAALYGVGNLVDAAIGPQTSPGTWVSGLGISPTAPASLSVVIDRGSIYTDAQVDASAYGVLGTDTNIVGKQGIIQNPTVLTITPPTTSGFSQVFLVQVAYQDVDGNPTLLPYFDSADPGVPFSGPAGSGTEQNTVRFAKCVVGLKAGAAAATGSQVAPSPDAGFVGLYAISVHNGQTTIQSTDWYTIANAPFIIPLTQIPKLFQKILTVNTTFNINNAFGSDTTGDGSAQFPWQTLAHAYTQVSTYNLAGNTITLQLALTGASYASPGNFSAPAGGLVIIQGDATAQASYTIAGNPANGTAVVAVVSGNVKIVGLTLANLTAIGGSSNVAAVSSNVTLQNVTFGGNVGTQTSHLVSNPGAVIAIGPGCIWSKGGGTAINCNGGQVIQSGNSTVTGAPAFSVAFIVAATGGTYQFASPGGWTWTGTATGQKYNASLNGVINTSGSGANFFPGSTAGAISSGGQYA